jgi:hypothetical protein
MLQFSTGCERAGQPDDEWVAQRTNRASSVAPTIVLAALPSLIGFTVDRQRQWCGMTARFLESLCKKTRLRKER